MTMPTFLMLGGAKAGTSSLYAYMRQHPAIFLSEVRECDFFVFEGQTPRFHGPGDDVALRRYITTLDRYQALFRGAGDRPALGESSDLYLDGPGAARRIRDRLPEAKLIVILRDPADRAYSQFKHLVRDGREMLDTFEQALDAEDERVAKGWHPIWHLTRRGFYAGQLEAYLDLFPREQISVHLYDDFVADPPAVLRALFQFLEVDPEFRPDMSLQYNVSGAPRSELLHAFLARPLPVKDFFKPFLSAPFRHRVRARLMNSNIVPDRSRMAKATRKALIELYRADILRLEALLQRDLGAWLKA